ncbi:uncharacterized protein LAESUDRAFT_752575 [Laetiporus sulphureus 93-53]|uniref:G domain-containing protein n=1 Tax=Laetiporus sulphureus 93-53 TaxID=1314785 RepID=A0A165BR92_9APHY|nr:uncharacterized protein LAESUDRAFT_752575 [Laetiporus sulphureus 93-53]KZT01507.1 hypothetical protein LAESUDRAFT_752575 [Laetiporus sulphureus 93-53]
MFHFAKQRNTDKLQPIIILVMGPTGVGKTSFINLVSGSQLRVSKGLESTTAAVEASQSFTFQDRYRVTLIDTPGFDDTKRSDAEILTTVAQHLSSSFKRGEVLTGVAYLHRISDNRMGGIALRNFKMFTELCGKEALSNAAIVLNMWNEVEEDVAIAREQELRTNFFRPAIDAGAQLFRNDNTRSSTDAILSYLSSRSPAPLAIQRELLEQHKALRDTAAGMALLGTLEKKKRENEQRLQEMMGEIDEAIKRKDSEDQRELKGAYDKLQELKMKLEQERQQIQADDGTTGATVQRHRLTAIMSGCRRLLRRPGRSSNHLRAAHK